MIAGTIVLAIGVTVAWWSKVDITPLFATAEIRRGQVWRLLTSILPHVDIVHLAFNAYWVWVFGSLIEQVYGHLKALGLLALLAVGAGAFDFALASGGVGLSGVGYGLFGFLWVASRHDSRFRDAVDQRTVILFVAWFIFCIITTVTNTLPVANVAHAAGAVFGVLLAAGLNLPHRRWLMAAGVAVLLLAGLWGATFGRPRVNLSAAAGYEEGQWGYDALLMNHNAEAIRWLHDATLYQPSRHEYWFDLAIAYERVGNKDAAAAAYERARQLEGDSNPAAATDKAQ